MYSNSKNLSIGDNNMNKRMISYYLICGILTTIINISVYYILTRLFRFPYLLSNIIAWIVSVIFAYIVNKKFVFTDSEHGFWYKLPNFFCLRLASGIFDNTFMFYLVTILFMEDSIAKLLVGVIVTIINYLVSKFLIFI